MKWFFRRQRPTYPPPESLIIRLPDDVPDRILPLEGVINFRDVGGYRTTDGQLVRRGLVYRSSTLAGLTDADLAVLGQMGVRLVCDLRGDDEVAAGPDRLAWTPAPIYLRLPIAVENDSRRRMTALLFNPASIAPMMTDLYTRVMIDGNARLYGNILRRLTDPANLPTVIHCTAGKDRTGIAVALLLSLLGVPDDVIAADYSLSNIYYSTFITYGEWVAHRMRWFGIRAEDLQPFLVADPANMRITLRYLRDKYGSTEQYLQDAAGLSADDIPALRDRLLE